MPPFSRSGETESLVWPVFRATAIVSLATALAALVRRLLRVEDVEMIFLLGVMVTALLAGRRAAVVAAALSVALFDFLGSATACVIASSRRATMTEQKRRSARRLPR